MRVLVHEVAVLDDSEVDIVSVMECFRQTEQCKWLSQVSYKPIQWQTLADPRTFSTRIYVYAHVTEQDLTFYRLKWK